MPVVTVSLNGTRVIMDSPEGSFRNETVPSFLFYDDQRPEKLRGPKPKGRLPCKPYSMQQVVRRGATGSDQSRNPPNYRSSGDMVQLNAGGYPTLDTNLDSQAFVKALLSLKQQRVNYGVALAEAKDTAEFIGDTASRIAKSYKRLAALDPKGAIKALGVSRKEDVPKRWLEHQYALNPLLQDVKGSIDNLIGFPRHEWATRVQGKAKRLEEGEYEKASHFAPGVEPYTTEYTSKAVIYYAPQNAALASLASLGLSNPAEIVWERVPFSFVADWFIPIGDWFSSFDAAVGYEFLDGCCTRFARRRSTYMGGYNQYGFWTGPRPSGSVEAVVMQRIVLTSSPIPSFPRPDFKSSVGKLANGLSLLTQVFKKR